MAVFKKSDSVRDYSTGSASEVQEKETLIGKFVTVNGEVKADENILIQGKIEGNINIKKRVTVGKSGLVTADIMADEVLILGRVDGNVNGTSKVEIKPEGILNGNIVSKRVVLAEGAVFKGNIDMSVKDDSDSKKNNNKTSEKK